MNNEQSGAVTYVALGDSTGVGVGATHGGYVARIFERIEHERPHSSLSNLCVSGATTEDVLRGQVDAAVAKNPTLITLGVGVNDIGHGFSEDKFARNYEEILKRIRAKSNAPIVVTNIPDVSLAPVIPPAMRAGVNARVHAFNEKIETLAERYDLRVVDAYTSTHQLVPEHPEFFSADGFHPSDIGYEYWAKMMWPIVKSAIGR
ncbi:MAG: hypothetical protein AUG51_17495 [Acidobacteria bacterium 13_1_20CM_3_53_8]|nr:MAG: hypothetical protein AUG51_17495 [Acidobacteria bacterium 13_1_20CM_3_53_8]